MPALFGAWVERYLTPEVRIAQPPRRFGRMRRQHYRRAQLRERSFDHVGAHAALLHAPQSVDRGAGIVRAVRLRGVALLADVGELKEQRERLCTHRAALRRCSAARQRRSGEPATRTRRGLPVPGSARDATIAIQLERTPYCSERRWEGMPQLANAGPHEPRIPCNVERIRPKPLRRLGCANSCRSGCGCS